MVTNTYRARNCKSNSTATGVEGIILFWPFSRKLRIREERCLSKSNSFQVTRIGFKQQGFYSKFPGGDGFLLWKPQAMVKLEILELGNT